MSIGDKIKKARLNAGLSQEQMAEKLCVSRQAITKWENNRGIPDTMNLKSIAKLLDVSIDYLLDDNLMNDQSTIKEKIDWDKYPVVAKFSIQLREDFVVNDFYSDAKSIVQLSWSRNLSTKEKVLDFAFPGAIYTSDHFRDSAVYYFVDKVETQYLISVDKEFITSIRLPCTVQEKKFAIGDIVFSKTLHKVK